MSRKYYLAGTDDTLLALNTTSATAARTANLDTKGADYATIRVAISAELNTNSTNVAIQLSESDDTVVTNFATWDATYNRTVDNTSGVVATNHIDLRGRKRYIRLTITPDTTTNGTVVCGAVSTLAKEVKTGTTSDYGEDVIIA